MEKTIYVVFLNDGMIEAFETEEQAEILKSEFIRKLSEENKDYRDNPIYANYYLYHIKELKFNTTGLFGLNDLAKEIRSDNSKNGWYIKEDWQSDEGYNLGRLLTAMHSSLSSILECYRHSRLDNAKEDLTILKDQFVILEERLVEFFRQSGSTARDLPNLIALYHSELSEMYNAFLIDDRDNCEEEFADEFIRLLDTLGQYKWNIESAILQKLETNRGRGFKHGNKKL